MRIPLQFVHVGLAALLLTACARREAPPPNIILISVDTLRSDRLPAYGYHAIRTPAINRLRTDSVLFARAWTHYPLTVPAHASMLTGWLPEQHGLRDNSGYALDADVTTVAEHLRQAGYATGAFVSSDVLDPRSGLGRGFDAWNGDFAARRARPGHETTAAARRWIEAQEGGRPFFLFLHTYEPHSPYDPLPGITAPYDAEVVRTDRIIGAFLDGLRAQGLYEDALIIFTSDHGEGLGEHGEDQHGILLYRPMLQIPLLVKLPRGLFAGKSVVTHAQLLDVAPLILEHAGLHGSAEALPGSSLEAIARGDHPERSVFAETLYPRNQLGWHELRSVIAGDHHLIAGRRVELFELRADPLEVTNIADRERRVTSDLLCQLANDKPASPPSAAANRQQLRSLGYLSGGDPAETTFHPDPRDRMAILEQHFKLVMALRREELESALTIADQILERDPDLPEIWERKAMALLGLGRDDDAAAAVAKAMSLTDGRDH